jgi:hypothetical protein
MSIAKIKYATEAAITISLASLASDVNLLAGRASTAESNAVNLFNDVMVSGKIRTGTSPTVGKTIEVWAYAQYNDTPTYVDGITGTDANKTITSANVKSSALRLLWATTVDATTDRDYFMPPTSLADRFGSVPKRWGIFVVHDTAVAFNSGGSVHEFKYTGVNYESV